MASSSNESYLIASPERTVAPASDGKVTDRAGLATNNLDDVRSVRTGGTVPPEFGTAVIAGHDPAVHSGEEVAAAASAPASTSRELPALPDVPAAPGGGEARPHGETTTATSKNIADAWQALNSATTPEAKEAALQRFRGAVTSADQDFKVAERQAEKAADEAASKYPGVGPHDFSQSRAELDKGFKAMLTASSNLSPEQRDQVGPQVDRWSDEHKTSRSEREKIEADIRQQYPALADAMQQVRQVQERYAPFYAHGEQVEDQLRGTEVGKQDRDAFQSRLDARQALAIALGSTGRSGESDSVSHELRSIEEREAPVL